MIRENIIKLLSENFIGKRGPGFRAFFEFMRVFQFSYVFLHSRVLPTLLMSLCSNVKWEVEAE